MIAFINPKDPNVYQFLNDFENLANVYNNTFYYINYESNREFAFELGLFDCITPCVSFSAKSTPMIKAGEKGELFFPMSDNMPKNFVNLEMFINSIARGQVRGGMLLEKNEKALKCV